MRKTYCWASFMKELTTAGIASSSLIVFVSDFLAQTATMTTKHITHHTNETIRMMGYILNILQRSFGFVKESCT